MVEHLLTVVVFFLALTLVARVSRGHQRPGGAIAWLLAMVFIPYAGVPLYLLVSGRKLGRRMERKCALYEVGAACGYGEGMPRDTERVLQAAGMPPRRVGNAVTLHFNGESAYAELVALLESAERAIHVMVFILGRDETGRGIVEVLTRKAAQGVQVRLLLDSLGSLTTKHRFVRPLRDAGGAIGHFLPVLPVRRRWSANLRNHRKIAIVDGRAAMVGGMNLDGRFMGPRPDARRFLDSAVFLRGPAVGDIEDVFASDWEFATGQAVPRAAAAAAPVALGDSAVQVVASGPDVPEDALHDAMLTGMMDARERIWVVTPYFVPDEPILKVLALQARAGRNIRVVLPARSNHRIPDLARGPAVRQLLRAGAKIYAYPRMVHAKVVLFDDTLAITGSPNLDMRSMYLNFEIALLHYWRPEIAHIAAWVSELAAASEPVMDAPTGRVREWAEGLAVLAAPLL